MKFTFVMLGPEDDSTSKLGLGLRYQERGPNIIRVEHKKNGDSKTILVANFHARIVRDILMDGGDDQRRRLSLEATIGGKKTSVAMSAAEFHRMGWVLNKLGPQAIIYPGQQQHARAAIQWLSRAIPQERIFVHLGWRKLGEQWVYLHAGGALGAEGPVAHLQAQLPDALQRYSFRPLHDSKEAVRASLRLLSVASDAISLPLLAAVYRAPFGRVDFSVFMTGQTGTFKTALAALCQQHFGSDMDAEGLPANFASTANALEGLAFAAKDALLVVDDFVPIEGNHALQALAERIFRAAGNRQGRNRMGADGTVRPPQPPRALLLATGEQVPKGQSIRARLLILQVKRGDIDRSVLSECQRAGRIGLFATAMAAYVKWIANRYEELLDRLDSRTRELREGYQAAVHARLPAALASLQSGFELWLEFALETGVIAISEMAELRLRNEKALKELAASQTRYHQRGDPAQHFLALLRAAFASGRAHVADRLGTTPEAPEIWGWRNVGGRAMPQGARIGWIAGSDLYLDSTVSYRVAQELAEPEFIPITEQTLRQRLRERGLLSSVDTGREMVQVRRTLEGRPRLVLHLRCSDLMDKTDA